MGTITIFRIILSIFPQLLKANISFFLERRKENISLISLKKITALILIISFQKLN